MERGQIQLWIQPVRVVVHHGQGAIRDAQLTGRRDFVRGRHTYNVPGLGHDPNLGLGLEAGPVAVDVRPAGLRVVARGAHRGKNGLAQRVINGGHKVGPEVAENATQVIGAVEVVGRHQRPHFQGGLEGSHGADADNKVDALERGDAGWRKREKERERGGGWKQGT